MQAAKEINLVYNFKSYLQNDSVSTAANCYNWNVKQKISLDHMVHAVATLEYTETMCDIYGNLEGLDR